MTAPLDLATQQELSLRYGEYTRLVAKDQHKRPGIYDDDGVRQYGLIAFVRYFWHILEPETKFVDGWPLWSMCEHLEAVTAGRITRLLMNVPPGHMKSLLTDVFWPAWEWGPMGKAHFRYVTFSYSASLTERDNDRFRLLIASPEYQALYGPMVTTVEDEAGNVLADVGNVVRLRNKTTIKVINSKLGFKLASSVGGVGTGERGDRIIIDDPHNVTEAESDRIRGETIKWFRESISSRFNDLDLGALVIIMQRVHQDDISGIVLGAGFDYCHLMIPWEYDPTRAVSEDGEVLENDIGWVDPRCDPDDLEANDGEPAWPERFSPKAMARTKAETGEYGWAAQYQQSPMPRGGGLFKREWWQPWAPESGEFPLFDYVLASLDVAVTEKASNNPSGLTVWGLFPLPEDPSLTGIMLIYAFRKRLMIHGADTGPRLKHEIPTPGDSRQMVINKEMMLARRVGAKWGLVEWVAHVCKIRMVDKLLIEAEKGGIVVAQEMARLYGDEPWAVQCMPVKGDKYARALAVEPTFAQGKVWAPVKDWSEMVIEEMEVFPAGKYDDLTDSATQAIKYLRDAGLAQTEGEVRLAEFERVRHKPKQRALYPV